MSNLDDKCPSVLGPLSRTKQGKGYVPYKGHGAKNVSVNRLQEKPEQSFEGKDTIECNGVKYRQSSGKLAKFATSDMPDSFDMRPDWVYVREVTQAYKPRYAKPRANSPFKRAKATPVIIRKG